MLAAGDGIDGAAQDFGLVAAVLSTKAKSAQFHASRKNHQSPTASSSGRKLPKP